jgi:hypothetical protein
MVVAARRWRCEDAERGMDFHPVFLQVVTESCNCGRKQSNLWKSKS